MSERDAPPTPSSRLEELKRIARQRRLEELRAKAQAATAPPPEQPVSADNFGLLGGLADRPAFQGVDPNAGVPTGDIAPEAAPAFAPDPASAPQLPTGGSLEMEMASLEDVPGALSDEIAAPFHRLEAEADAALDEELAFAARDASDQLSLRIAESQAYAGRIIKWLTNPFEAMHEHAREHLGADRLTFHPGQSPLSAGFQAVGEVNEIANQGVRAVTGLGRTDSQGIIDVGTAVLPFKKVRGAVGGAAKKAGKLGREFAARKLRKPLDPTVVAENVAKPDAVQLGAGDGGTVPPKAPAAAGGEIPFEEAFDATKDRVVTSRPKSELPTRLRLTEAFFDKNASAPVLERSLGKKPDPGTGPGTGKGITAELAAAEGSTAHKAMSFLESGHYQQGFPDALKHTKAKSFGEAMDNIGGKENLDLAGQYAVAKREMQRYHANDIRGDFTPEQARAIVNEIEGNPGKYQGILDAVERMDAETRFLARELDDAGGASEGFFQASQAEGLYVHLDRIVDPSGAKSAGKARPFSRVKGSSDRVQGTINPLVSHERIVGELHSAIAKARQSKELAKLASKGGVIEPIPTPTVPVAASIEQIAAGLEGQGVPKALADDLAQYQGSVNIWKKRGEFGNEFVTYELDPKTGKRVEKWYRVNGELPQRVLELVQHVDTKPGGPVLKKMLGVAQAAVTLKRLGTTALSPGFIAANFLIDSTVAAKQTSLKTKTFNKVPILRQLPGREFAKEGLRATGQAMHESARVALKPFGVKLKQLPEWAAFESSGALAHTFGKNDPALVYSSQKKRAIMRGEGFFEDSFKSLVKVKKPKWVDFYGEKGGRKYLVLDPIKYATDVMSPFEGVFRKAEQRGLLKREGFTDPTQVLPQEVANRSQLAGSRVTLSFQRGGTVTKNLNRYAFPFVNAWTQGLYTDFKLAKGRPREYAARTMAMMGAGAALWLYNRDKESYKDAPDWQKAGYVGLYDDDGFDTPIGKTNALLAFRAREHLAPMKAIEAVLESIHREDPKVAEMYARELAEAFAYSPLESFVGTPAFEVATGHSLFKEQPINPRGTENMAGVLPEDVAKPDTSSTARWIASLGTGITAAETQFLMDNVAGHVPGQAIRSIESALGAAPPDSKTAEAKDTPFLGRFVGRLSGSQTVRDFYQLRSEVTGFREAASRFNNEDQADRIPDVAVSSDGTSAIGKISKAMKSHAERYRTAKTDEERIAISKQMRELAKAGIDVLKLIDPRARAREAPAR